MEINSDMITQFGLMNKISSGNPMFDVLLCLLVPILIKQLLPRLHNFFHTYFVRRPAKNVFERHVEHSQSSSYWWSADDDGASNTILQKAILNYINTQVDTLRAMPDADLQLKPRPKCDEAAAEEKVKRVSGGDDDDEDDGSESDDADAAEQNKHNYAVNVVPPLDTWIELKNGIKFMREEVKENNDNKLQKITTIYSLQSEAKDGNVQIENFVAEALELYKAQLTAKVDLARYLYIPVLNAKISEDAEAPTAALYKRYKLSEDRSFASFFHPDKGSILNLVDQFQNKQGKFGIAGYPHKLGFLLYGPPGTGKTSFIKALAHHTRRSVISIPLTKISTNQELMDIMFDQKIKVENGDAGALQLPFSKTIFVMEDVDAASSVVQKRTSACDPDFASPAPRALMQQHAKAAAAAASSCNESSDGHEVADQDKERGTCGQFEIVEESSCPAAATAMESFGNTSPKASDSRAALYAKWLKPDDELNLAGLLNVLDGVVDTPGRIVIMTTNHPEKLDPALIRPGRINKKIYMGRCKVEQALCMIRHYFCGQVTAGDEAELRQMFVDDALSPAELEAMCAEFDTVAELTAELASKFAYRMARMC